MTQALQDWIWATPDAVAVDGGSSQISYAELGDRATRIAGAILDAGVSRGGIVALALDDPVDLIIAMVGTVFAGAAYLAIDRELPAERICWVLQDAGPQLIVMRGDADIPGDGLRLRIEDARVAGARPLVDAAPDDPAVVYFTSGSTGRPKGVPLPHRGVTRLFTGDPPMDLAPGARMGHAAYPMFDATTLEVWGPLLQGATIVVLPRPALLDPATLRGVLAHRRIDTLFLTTALFREIATREPAAFADLATLHVGGEALDSASVRAVFAAGPPRRLRNLYGPTETTTLATWHEVTWLELDRAAVPIGRAVPGTTVHVLDERMSPVPVGGEGGIYVGGDGLGPGYLGRPGLTATRYLPDPDTPGARIYRTGDRAQVLEGGVLDFRGRDDRQVKVRGYRIEPAEVEAVLAGHPAVAAVAVEAAATPSGQGQLVAFVVGGAAEDDLRQYAADHLPAHMIPARFVALDQLPITPGGKIDRSRLVAAHAPDAPTPPSGAAHGRVAAIWASVLGLPAVPHDRNFFDVGGTSLLLMQVQGALQTEFGSRLAIGDLLAHPTVRAQAALITGTPAAAPVDGGVPDPADARERLRRRREALIRKGRTDA